MNPPYMGGGKMDNVLAKYVKDNYPDSKADLMTIFMEVAMNTIVKGGYWAMINLPSWMFLSTFSSLRDKLLRFGNIDSLLHMGRGIFGIDWGSTAFVIHNTEIYTQGVYFRLHKRNFQHIYFHHIEQLFLNALNNHNFHYDFDSYRENDTNVKKKEINHSENGLKLYFSALQTQFNAIPGSPIAYWLSPKVLSIFRISPRLDSVLEVKTGLSPGETDRFIRNWHEVEYSKISFDAKSLEDVFWVPITRGEYRRWYGNNWSIINWADNGFAVRNHKGASIRNSSYYLQEGIVWPDVNSTQNLCARYTPNGFIYQDVASGIFCADEYQRLNVLALMNSKFINGCTKILNPTIHFKPGNVASLPLKTINADPIIQGCILLSRQDWDAHETSWDFQRNGLLDIDADKAMSILSDYSHVRGICIDKAAPEPAKLEWLVSMNQMNWEAKFMRLHANEEELNRQFIEIYGLQDELTPDVPLDEVTILQQGEITIKDSEIVWNNDVVIKQLISYIVGVWMGRYRLDRPGLHIAHPNPSEEELAEYTFNLSGSEETLRIDEDAVIPVLPQDAPFFDNLYNYVVEFVRKVWGEEKLAENINFIEKCLGKNLNDYLMKDFWKDHKKMYQNRPIYWEFASKKGAFRALVYAHRMDRYTVEVLRSKYLLPYRAFIERKIAALDARSNDLSTKERKELDNLRNKILPELSEYAERVEVVAQQSAMRDPVFDLDDGIIKNHALFGDIVTKLK